MQNDYCGCEPHDQCGGAKGSESVEIAGYNASDPKYERHKAATLQPERKYDQKNRHGDFMKQGHPRRKSSVNGDLTAFARFVLGKQEAQQKHHRGSRSEQPVDLDVGEGLSLCHYEAVHSGKRLLTG